MTETTPAPEQGVPNTGMEALDDDGKKFLLSYHASAWKEINTRIAARQTVQLGFAAAVLSLATTAFVTNASLGKSNAELGPLFHLGIAIAAVTLSWLFNFWVQHNEKIIGLLVSYCREIEKTFHGATDAQSYGWFSGRHMKGALVARRNSDKAMIVIHMLTAAPSIMAIVNYWLVNNQYDPVAVIHGILVPLTLIPAVIAYNTYKYREQETA